MPVALAVHGGAWNIPDDAVEIAVRLLEDDPTFNAGRGSHLNSAGRVELDASITSGAHLEAGAVAAVNGARR